MAGGSSSHRSVSRLGENQKTERFRAESDTPAAVIDPREGNRKIVAFRFVNTHATEAFKPMVWVVPRGESPGIDNMYFPEGFCVRPGLAVREPGTIDSPCLVIGYGDTIYMAAIEGSGNIFYVLSEDLP